VELCHVVELEYKIRKATLLARIEKRIKTKTSINSNFLRQSVLFNIWHRTYQQLANKLTVPECRRCVSYYPIVNVDQAGKLSQLHRNSRHSPLHINSVPSNFLARLNGKRA
jgi:hypothetical protein